MNKGVLGLLVLALALGVAAQQAGERPPRTLVTLDGKLEDVPSLTPADFEIEAGKQKAAPTRVYKPGELPSLVAIVLQDNQTQAFGTQLPALRDFILAQPANTYVGLFYLTAGKIETLQEFDSDLKKVAEKLRAPQGQQQLAPPTPYGNLVDIIDFMNKLPDARKQILLFSEGTDALAGDAPPSENRYLKRAVDLAQRAGIPVWAIYSDALAPRDQVKYEQEPRDSRQSPPQVGPQRTPGIEEQLTGQRAVDARDDPELRPRVQYNVSNLNYLTERSGGKTFSAGKFATDIRPFLNEFQRLMSQQFLLEYSASEPPKKVKLARELRGVKLLHAKR